jgi:hypothetical protein
MTRPRPATCLTACVVLALAAVFAGTAGAGSVATTTVKIKKGPPAFHGKVKSDVDLCVNERLVFIKRERNNKNKKIGETRTDANGNWTIEIDPLKSGSYKAKVKKANNVEPGISCIGAKSKVVTVD